MALQWTYYYSGPYGAQRVVWVAQSSMGNEQVNSPTESAKSRFWYKPMILQWILCMQKPVTILFRWKKPNRLKVSLPVGPRTYASCFPQKHWSCENHHCRGSPQFPFLDFRGQHRIHRSILGRLPETGGEEEKSWAVKKRLLTGFLVWRLLEIF